MLPREPDDVGIDDDAYEITDPKHSRWAEAMADRADMDRKRAKEDGHEAERLLKEQGFEVYGWVPMEADE